MHGELECKDEDLELNQQSSTSPAPACVYADSEDCCDDQQGATVARIETGQSSDQFSTAEGHLHLVS